MGEKEDSFEFLLRLFLYFSKKIKKQVHDSTTLQETFTFLEGFLYF